MVEDFKEIYKVKAELKVFGKPMFHEGKETGMLIPAILTTSFQFKLTM
jgi:hypothetical protein